MSDETEVTETAAAQPEAAAPETKNIEPSLADRIKEIEEKIEHFMDLFEKHGLR